MYVTKEGIEQIKSANDLASVVAERGIEVRRKGKSLVGSCPFHEETTPSFTITPSKGLFHCFGCGASGDVIGFVSRYDQVPFPRALEALSKRAGLSLSQVMKETKSAPAPRKKKAIAKTPPKPPSDLLARVVEHYHKTLCEREDAQEYLRSRGLVDAQLVLDFQLGYADGSLLKLVPKGGALREELVGLGVVTENGRELLGGCLVVPIPDPSTGLWTSLYGRGMRTDRHCYLPGPLRGVVNYQAARSSSEVVLTESILDALSFYQAGIKTAIPIYGTNGFTGDHLDLLKRESVSRVVLALDADEPGRKATEALKEKLREAGIDVSSVSYPSGVKDPNELLVSLNGDAGDVFRKLLTEAPPSKTPSSSSSSSSIEREDGQLLLRKGELSYRARAYPPQLGRFKATIKVEKAKRFHVDTLDLYSSRSRSEFGRRASKALELEEDAVESDLLALLVEAEKLLEEGDAKEASKPPPMTETERSEALSFLRSPELLDQVARDIDALGYVGEEMNKRLLYLVAVSRKLADPLSAVILSQSGAGKSGLTEVIEKLTPPEDVVLLTRLTPQSLYYVDDDFLDQKLVIIEERYGSMEADYSIRVLQSRKKLIAAAPVKDPQTGNMRTKVFSVEARAAFIEATTASSVNHENATRCFELAMDESVEQTRRIHERQRLMRTEAGVELGRKADAVVKRHWNAQRLLEPLRVVLPFADQLRFPSSWMRTRRDHARFLNLIEVSAFLHQHQREKKDGVLVANADDYRIAYELSGQVLTDTFSDLKRPLRDAYQLVQGLCEKNGGTVSRREIRNALGLADSTVRGWLTELVELEYLVAVDGGGRGKPVRYGLHERAPTEKLVLGLLKPEELGQKIARTRKNAKRLREG